MQDIHALAGRFVHRASNTENEREAGEYIQQRMRLSAPDTMHDPFDSIDSWALLFAAYYGEFLVVSLVAAFYPLVGFAYGLLVFIAYLAEFTGYHLLTRFLPQFASQNVMGRILAPRPKRLVVVTAHYDSGPATWLSNTRVVPWLPRAHAAIVLLMVLILVTCAADGLTDLGSYAHAAAIARWGAAIALASAALLLLVNERMGEPTRGAVDNSSGVAALLALGRRLHDAPLESTEVLLLATGSMAGGLNGMHHFLRHQDLDRELTYFLNFDQVGAGKLGYTRGEGMLHVFGSSPEWLALARQFAPDYDAAPFTLRALPTDMLIPLARGYKSMTIMGVDSRRVPPLWRSPDDSVGRADFEQVERAAAFAEAMIRQLGGPEGR